jgi:hypothetical protein
MIMRFAVTAREERSESMGTYIIHFDDKPWEDLDDELYYRCFEIPWFSTTKTTISRLTPYTEDSAYAHGYTEAESKYREIRDELEKQAYQKGLSDAWDAARKIASDNAGRNYSIFGQHFTVEILNTHSASECIEKIRQYEQEKDRQARIEYNFDEIKDVLETTVKECNVSLDEIAEVLQKMKETDNG